MCARRSCKFWNRPVNRLHQGQLEIRRAALEKASKDLKQFEDADVSCNETAEQEWDLDYMYAGLRAIKSVACDELRYTKQRQFREKCNGRDEKIERRRGKYMWEIEDNRRKEALIDSGDWYQPDDSSGDTDCEVERNFQADMEKYRRNKCGSRPVRPLKLKNRRKHRWEREDCERRRKLDDKM